MPACRHCHAGPAGFSLLELAVVLCVLATLALLATPAFLDQQARSRRVDATLSLQHIEWAQARHHLAHGRYAERMADLQGAAHERSRGGHYRIELLSHGPDAYDALALATASQRRDRDCQTLTLRVQGMVTQRQPSAACWPL